MALLNLDNDYDLEKYDELYMRLRERKGWVEIKSKTQRTLKQNNYLQVLLKYFASEFGYTYEEVKEDIFKKRVNYDIFKTIRKGNRCERESVRSSATLTTEEMTTAINRFRNYSVSVCDFYLPSADEPQALMHAQQQIERYKEFL